jgi:hypothetical protein
LHNFLRRQRRVGILGWRPVKRRQPVLGVGDDLAQNYVHPWVFREPPEGRPAARIDAELVVDRWNRRLATGRDMLWAPRIRAALLAGTPWLDVFCPGSVTSRAIDLRTVDRHPLASFIGRCACASAPSTP